MKCSLKKITETINIKNTIKNLNIEFLNIIMSFFNNNRVVHGRTSFEDFEDIEKKRLMIRTWIKDN